MVPPCSDRITRVPTYSIRTQLNAPFRDTGLSPTMAGTFQSRSHYDVTRYKCLRAGPRSLAATKGISVDFFSSGYLDVSVPRVRFPRPMYSVQGYLAYASGFPHSEISGSKSGCQLPEAFRRLQRPSSPPAAKASTVCAYSLDHIPKQSSLHSRKYIISCRHQARSTSHRIYASTRIAVYSHIYVRSQQHRTSASFRYYSIYLVKEHPGVKPRRNNPSHPQSALRSDSLPRIRISPLAKWWS